MTSRVRSRKWVFTINNYIEEDESNVDRAGSEYYVFGREVGESGTKHLQGFIYFKNDKSFAQLKKMLPRAHIEKAVTIDEAIEYCKKDGDYGEKGEPPKSRKKRGDMEKTRWADARKAAEEGRFDEIPADIYCKFTSNMHQIHRRKMPKPADGENVCGVWFYGPSGAGKSYRARAEYPDAYLKPCNKWWDGYQGEDNVIVDDIDPNHKVLGHHFKIWADRYSFIAEVKGGAVHIRPKKIVVTSQYHPQDIWEDLETRDAIGRRFEIIYVGPRYNQIN